MSSQSHRVGKSVRGQVLQGVASSVMLLEKFHALKPDDLRVSIYLRAPPQLTPSMGNGNQPCLLPMSDSEGDG